MLIYAIIKTIISLKQKLKVMTFKKCKQITESALVKV